MKNVPVYLTLWILLIVSSCALTGCARKSGCAAVVKTTKTKLRKNGQPRKKADSLFDKRTTRRLGGGR